MQYSRQGYALQSVLFIFVGAYVIDVVIVAGVARDRLSRKTIALAPYLLDVFSCNFYALLYNIIILSIYLLHIHLGAIFCSIKMYSYLGKIRLYIII